MTTVISVEAMRVGQVFKLDNDVFIRIQDTTIENDNWRSFFNVVKYHPPKDEWEPPEYTMDMVVADIPINDVLARGETEIKMLEKHHEQIQNYLAQKRK